MSLKDNHSQLMEFMADLEEKQVYREVERLLDEGSTPLKILQSCQEAMRRIGKRYEDRHYYVSGLIMAGEIMRQVTELLMPYLEPQKKIDTTGLVLLGTVEEDIHDIGKNLFKIFLRGTGFQVVDLGVDVPSIQFLKAVQEYNPNVIGLSALLTVAYEPMRKTISELKKNSPHIPIIIGGGFIDEKVRQYVGADYFAEDAVAGVKLCNSLKT